MIDAQMLREELEKAASLVVTARRLLATGTMVDLSALEGKVRYVCDAVLLLDRSEGRPLIPLMERLIGEMDKLDTAIREQVQAFPGDSAGEPAAP